MNIRYLQEKQNKARMAFANFEDSEDNVNENKKLVSSASKFLSRVGSSSTNRSELTSS